MNTKQQVQISPAQTQSLNSLKTSATVAAVSASDKGVAIVFTPIPGISLNPVIIRTKDLWESDAVAANQAFLDAVDAFTSFFKSYSFPAKND